ncbi:MAG: tetratricopeptide repeat protein [Candidatus Omnitrophica bacterium]|nr:tetratricopeptide repeat protein [Candidatus Omnitrophota bacterium]
MQKFPLAALLWASLCFFGAVLALTGARLKPGELVAQESAYYRQEGRRLQEQGDLSGALTAYQKSVLVNPKYADAYNDLGVILESLGDEVNARFSYDRALSLRPDFAAAHTNLALLHEKAGRWEEAAEHWNARIRLGPPNNPWVQGARQKLIQHDLPVSEIPTKGRKSKGRPPQTKVAKAPEQARAAVPVKVEPPREAPRVGAPSPDAKALARSLAQEKERSAREQAKWKKRQTQLEKAGQKQAKQSLREKERGLQSEAKQAKARWEAQKAQAEAQKKPAVSAKASPSRPAAPLKRPPVSSDALTLAKDLAKEKAKTKTATIQELLEQGTAAMKARRYEEAASNMKGILLLEPDHRKAAQWLREAQEELARQAKSEPSKPPVEREVSPVVAEPREDRLRAEEARAEVQEARRQAEQVRAQVEEARRELGEMRRQMEETRRLQAVPPIAAAPAEAGAPAPSAEEVRQAALEKQRRVRDLYEQGVDQMRRGLFEEAQVSFQEILSLNPNHEEARQGLQRAQKVLTKAGR